jgi:hypothetical protein
MEPISVLFLVVAIFAAIGLAASVWGVDTRPGLTDGERHPESTGIA